VVAPDKSREEIAVMGSVLAFQPRDAASTRKPNDAGVSASIVIFPGVRYERREDAPRDTTPTRRTARRDKPQPRH